MAQETKATASPKIKMNEAAPEAVWAALGLRIEFFVLIHCPQDHHPSQTHRRLGY